jgi:putative SOS response-associated peptidase YedK
MNVRDSRVHNYPPRCNAAPSQDLLVIRRNHQTGEITLEPLRWGLIPHWCTDPKGRRLTLRSYPPLRCPQAASQPRPADTRVNVETGRLGSFNRLLSD